MDTGSKSVDRLVQNRNSLNASDKILRKRFYKDVDVVCSREDGYLLTLDGRILKTPGGRPMCLPTSEIAELVFKEWQAQSEFINRDTMPFTELCQSAIDNVQRDKRAIVEKVVAYAESDLICYFATEPAELVRQQAEKWNSIINWAKDEFCIALKTSSGIVHVAQSKEDIRRVSNIIYRFDEFGLAAFYVMVTSTGSVFIPLSFVYGQNSPDVCWQAAQIDEDWQNSRWGVDDEAHARTLLRRREFYTACRFIEGLGPFSNVKLIN